MGGGAFDRYWVNWKTIFSADVRTDWELKISLALSGRDITPCIKIDKPLVLRKK